MKSQTVRLTRVWLLALAATVLAWFLGHHSDGPTMRLAPMVASGILVIAFIKVALIMAYFMELRWAPNTLVAVATVWTIVEFALLVWPFAL